MITTAEAKVDLVKVRLPWAGSEQITGELVWGIWREPFKVEINNTPCHKGYSLGQVIEVEHSGDDGRATFFEHHPDRPMIFVPIAAEISAANKRGEEHLAAVRARLGDRLGAVIDEFKNEPIDMADIAWALLNATNIALAADSTDKAMLYTKDLLKAAEEYLQRVREYRERSEPNPEPTA
jgi:hypothetical protein